MYLIKLETEDTIYTVDFFELIDPEDSPYRYLIDPQLEQEVNTFGSLTFSVPPQHPRYNLFSNDDAEIIVERKSRDEETPNDILFRGRLLDSKMGSYLKKDLTYEGELSYLADSVQEPAEYKEVTPAYYLEQLLNVHNSKMPAKKRFTLGRVTVTDDDYADHITGRVNRGSYSTRFTDTTWSCISSLVSTLGGHIEVRWSNGVRYLDYLKDYEKRSGQNIQFGVNLIDYADEWSLAELYTAIVPLGGNVDVPTGNGDETKSEQLTIKNVNNGSPYLLASNEILAKYGRREKAVEFRGITDANHLKSIGQLYLNNTQFDNLVLSLTAADLTHFDFTSEDIQALDFLTTVRGISQPHGLDRDFPITKLSIPLKNPGNAIYSMSTNSRGVRNLSTAITDAVDELQDQLDDLKEDTEEDLDELKKEVAKITSGLAGEPGDWIFGEPIIVYAEEEIPEGWLEHSEHIIKVYDPQSSEMPLIKSTTGLGPDSKTYPPLYWEEAFYEKETDRMALENCAEGGYEETTWQASLKDSMVDFQQYIYGRLKIPFVQGNPSDSFVLYSVVKFPNKGLLTTSKSKAKIGNNYSGYLGINDDGYLTVNNQEQALTLTTKGSAGTLIESTLDVSDKMVVFAQTYRVSKGENDKKAWYSDSNFVVGMDDGFVWVPYGSHKDEVSVLSGTDYGYNYSLDSSGNPITEGEGHEASEELHNLQVRRIVLCQGLAGQITTDEVYDNVRYLVGRFVTEQLKEGDSVDILDKITGAVSDVISDGASDLVEGGES